MFEALDGTELGRRHALVGVDLPGTGGSRPLDRPLTLQVAAEHVAEVVSAEDARVIVGHSVGSIVASLAAYLPDSPIRTVLSLEGNLTAADAYFSGSAAGYDDAATFRAGLLARLGELAVDDPTISRYRDQVASADPQSIWELGCDTAEWSATRQPGEVLARSAETVRYLHNPSNTPEQSLRWLAENELTTIQLDGASHWAPVDQPDLTAQKLLDALAT
jgi:pimeloyl-ACP methyl ester carboxylesterase